MQRRQCRPGAGRESRIAAAGKLDGVDLVEDSKISSFPQKPAPLADDGNFIP
jgi:hypothetical protein